MRIFVDEDRDVVYIERPDTGSYFVVHRDGYLHAQYRLPEGEGISEWLRNPSDEAFNEGYREGYDDGESAAEAEAEWELDARYDEGYNDGYAAGYAEADSRSAL